MLPANKISSRQSSLCSQFRTGKSRGRDSRHAQVASSERVLVFTQPCRIPTSWLASWRSAARWPTPRTRPDSSLRVERVDDVGVPGVDNPALQLQRRRELLALRGPLNRQQPPAFDLLNEIGRAHV